MYKQSIQNTYEKQSKHSQYVSCGPKRPQNSTHEQNMYYPHGPNLQTIKANQLIYDTKISRSQSEPKLKRSLSL